MANYDSAQGIQNVIDNAAGLSAATVAAISALLTELGSSAKADNVTTSITSASQIASDAQVVIMGKDTSIKADFGADSSVQAIVVGGEGGSDVKFATSDNVTVQLQGGENDSVTTADGNDTITVAGGSANIDAGDGANTIVMQGGNATVQSGTGNDVLQILADATGAATVNAGDGFDLVSIVRDTAANHTFRFDHGKFIMNSDMELDMEGVNVVAFDGAGNGVITDMTILATTVADSLVGKLYKVALGREAIDNAQDYTDVQDLAHGELGGINFWMETFQSDQANTLQHTVYSFLNCQEFKDKHDNQSDAQYVESLFSNLGVNVNDTIGGMTVADYVGQIANGGANARFDVAWAIAASDEAVKLLGADGANYVIDGGITMEGPSA